MEYRVSLDTTLPIEAGIKRSCILCLKRWPGDPGGVYFPAGLARNPHSVADGAGFTDRCIHVFPTAWFFCKRIITAGLGTGHRYWWWMMPLWWWKQ